MNIVLIGMRGAGKTTAAKLLSKKLQKEVVEIDDLVAKKAGMTIANIVKNNGWDYFRNLESEIIKDIAEKNNIIISCGGGVVIKPKNIDLLKQNGKIFWLQVSVATLLKRIGKCKNRPSLTGKPQKEDMETVLKQRYDLYKNAADQIIDTEKLSKKEVANTISSYLYRYGIGIASRNGTQLCCIIGNPIKHSLSPAMHNAAYKTLGLNFCYHAFQVDDVKNAIAGIRTLRIRGASVTVPHKITVMQYLDKIDKTTQYIGAVNTIVNTNGKLVGYNTDSFGAIKALEEKTSLKDKKVVLVGAGGAAHAIAFGLKEKGTRILILNRNIEKAKILAHKVNADFGDLSKLPEIKKSNILIHATPTGMSPNIDTSLIPNEYLKKDLLVFDIVYNPKETKLIQGAKKAGCNIVYGYKMLLYQAVDQFEKFTNKKAPIAIMEKELLLCLDS